MRKPSLASQGCSVLSITTSAVGITRSQRREVGTRDLLSRSACGSAPRSGCKTATLGISKGKLRPEGEQPPPNNVTLQSMGWVGFQEDHVEDRGLPRPPAWARVCPALRVTCGLLQKSLPISDGLVHILLPVHNFLIQSLERKANWGYSPAGRSPSPAGQCWPEMLSRAQTAPTEHGKDGQRI